MWLFPGSSRGGVFPGPATFGGPPSPKNTVRVFQMASFWPQKYIGLKSIFGQGSAPDPARGAYDVPQTPIYMVRGHPSPRFLPPDANSASRSRRIRNKVVIGPRDYGSLGPAVALDRYGYFWLPTPRSCDTALAHCQKRNGEAQSINCSYAEFANKTAKIKYKNLSVYNTV